MWASGISFVHEVRTNPIKLQLIRRLSSSAVPSYTYIKFINTDFVIMFISEDSNTRILLFVKIIDVAAHYHHHQFMSGAIDISPLV